MNLNAISDKSIQYSNIIISTLTEYEGDTLWSRENFKLRGINSSNREQFKNILLLSYENRFKHNEMLNNIHVYNLTKDIKIREKWSFI